jgi:hypothetical protein
MILHVLFQVRSVVNRPCLISEYLFAFQRSKSYGYFTASLYSILIVIFLWRVIVRGQYIHVILLS